jgi:hypothetical protein
LELRYGVFLGEFTFECRLLKIFIFSEGKEIKL